MNTLSKIPAYLKRCGIFVFVLLFVLMPLQNDATLQNGVIVSKTFFFTEGIMLLLLIGCVIWLLSDGRVWLSISRIDVVLTLLTIYIILRSDGRTTPRMIELLALYCCYVLLRRSRWRHFLFLLYALSVAGIIQSVYGLLQLYNILPSHSQFRLTGTMFNLGAYAAFIALSAIVSLVLVFYFKEKRYSIIPQLNVVLAVIILPISQNRAAWMAVIVAGVFLYAHLKRKYVHYGLLIVAGVLVLAGGYFLKKDSADGRVLVWKVTSQMISGEPVTGIGYDRFAARYMNHQADYMQSAAPAGEKQLADNVYYAFNDLLQLTAELGIPGGIGILGLILICFSIKGHNNFRYAGQGIIVGYIIIGMFYYPHFILPLKMIGITGLAMLSRLDTSAVYSVRITQMPRLLLVFLIVIFGITGVVMIEQRKVAYQQWRQAELMYQQQRISESLQYYREAVTVLPKDGELLSAAGKAYFLADSLEKAADYLQQSRQYLNNTVIETTLGDISMQQGQYVAAEGYYQKALHMVPNRFYTEYMLLKLYVASNENDKACSKANVILQKQVKVSSTAVQQIQDSARAYYANNKCHR
ncbi:O-antigen ligase family protein [Chitinophaga rhizophila]|uniref:O-antigen ligase family protein n=1 Tax=Chitinophaga rhizophila TaxID=2866212 RepID=A0ABS7G912_9BACT|nr:O-antigen ligase family protein [Chitinophaga rhizophila]MBW8683881.1 O-antigen ligase family protein [Chitinophaga rhizophila]